MNRLHLSRSLVLITLAGLGLGLGGCVQQQSYDQLMEANRALKARNSELEEQNRQIQSTADALTGRNDASGRTMGDIQKQNAELRAALAAANERMAALDGRLGGLTFGPLDAATDAALQELASKYPGAVAYDSARGMLRFTSDVTFASGSFELSDQGRQTVGELGKILTQLPSAGQYDVQVVGHTDSQRVSGKGGRRFVNNDELSAFRAISVHTALVNAGMAKNRVMFAGFGESRPAVANAGNGNTPQNRRVEVYLVKTTASEGMPAATAPAAPVKPAAKPPAKDDLMK